MIKRLHKKLINKEITATELTQRYLANIKKSDLNAFITVSEKEALAQAKIIDDKIAAGEDISELAGIPISIKDIILTQDIKTTAGSKILDNYVAAYDATLVAKLKQAGAIIVMSLPWEDQMKIQLMVQLKTLMIKNEYQAAHQAAQQQLWLEIYQFFQLVRILVDQFVNQQPFVE